MIEREEAVLRAQQLFGHSELGFAELESAFVFWDLNISDLGTVHVFVDRQSGQWSQWPALPIPHLEKKFLRHRAALERFPEDVRLLLGLAGWAPGRDGAPMVKAWCRAHGLDLSAAARAVAAEFGGLRIAGWEFTPGSDGRPPAWQADGRWPIATRNDDSLCLDPTGAVFLHSGRRVAATFDEALITLARGHL